MLCNFADTFGAVALPMLVENSVGATVRTLILCLARSLAYDQD